MAALSRAAGQQGPNYADMPTALEVGGVGTGSQVARREVSHHIQFDNGQRAVYKAPELPSSSVPALLGQSVLRKQRALLDCFNGRMFCVGPGGYRLHLSPGSQIHELERSPAGHLMLACSSFKPVPKNLDAVPTLGATSSLLVTPEPGAVASSYAGLAPAQGKL